MKRQSTIAGSSVGERSSERWRNRPSYLSAKVRRKCLAYGRVLELEAGIDQPLRVGRLPAEQHLVGEVTPEQQPQRERREGHECRTVQHAPEFPRELRIRDRVWGDDVDGPGKLCVLDRKGDGAGRILDRHR